jgi:hypothetical protein
MNKKKVDYKGSYELYNVYKYMINYSYYLEIQ